MTDLVPIISDEIYKLTNEIPKNEIDRAKTQIIAGILMSLESTSSRCEQIARQTMIYGRPLELNKVIASIENVTEADLKCIGERLLKGNPTQTILGPA